MSTEPEEKSIHIESVDVVISSEENVSVSELTSDSGLNTRKFYPDIHDPSYKSVAISNNVFSSDEKRSLPSGPENESDSALSSPISVSPDNNDLTDNILCDNEFSLTKDDSTDETDQDSPAKDQNCIVFKQSDIVPDSTSNIEVEVSNTESNYEYKGSDLNNVNSRALTSSTVSLNEPNTVVAIKKTVFSRSAENISTTEQCSIPVNISNKEINTDKILSDFTSQKNKVAATQKIPETPNINTDLRYARLPKELLPQDLGSIVKNVHGIFSTVSGSLKNAYNNSHRISMQKAPVKPITKPIPNGKVMNDIFEDEVIEERPLVNGVDRIEVNPESTINVNGEIKNNLENTDSDSDSKKDVLKLQIEALEKLLAEQRKENGNLRERVKHHLDELQEKDHSFKDLEAKLDLMGKRVEQAEREKDAAVMRYASVECAAIEAKRAAERATAAERRALHEQELLANKLKTAHQEKQRICQLYDDKCHELSTSEREVSKVREELRELEGRLKWTQSKLRMEMDAYKDSAEKAEKLSQQVAELEAAKEAAATNATDSARAKQLDLELKESQAALILCRHEKDELERRLSSITTQLETCTRERDSATSSLALSRQEVEDLKVRNVQLEEEAAELCALRAQAALADTLSAQLQRQEVEDLRVRNVQLEEEAAELCALRAQAALADTLSAQLQRETDRCARAEAALAEATARGETCARREAAALDHAARLTAQHVAHNHAAQAHRDKVQALTADNSSLRERVTSLEEECLKLQTALSEETERRNKENKVLARKVAELTEEVEEANKKLEWEKGENSVLKKKHASAIKEMNRELQRSLKRCEQLEAKLPPPTAPSTRTGSISSLSSVESPPTEERLQNGHEPTVPDIQVREPDRQALIERIVSLQRAAARRAERCDFLEEHAKQLTGELRAKAKLLRHLLCTLPAGAVASQHRDANKKEIARLGGGAMAAVWGGDPRGVTPELSLEMNRRLQAVLEDALLKNITLKENMDTLGAEISRLKEQIKANAEAKSN